MIRPPHSSTLFPYTTLFRSFPITDKQEMINLSKYKSELRRYYTLDRRLPQSYISSRSEEHTSELQSRFDLVCRLLLEKKNDVGYTYVSNKAYLLQVYGEDNV